MSILLLFKAIHIHVRDLNSTYLDKAQHIPSSFVLLLQCMVSRPEKGWGWHKFLSC